MSDATQTRTPRARRSSTAKARARGYALHPQPNGKTRARVDLPPGPDGKRRQRTRILPTEVEAETWALEQLVATRKGTHIDRAPDTFGQRSEEWLRQREEAGVRPVTLRGYRVALAPALEAFGHKRVQDVTRADVRALMRSLSHRKVATNRQTLYTVRGTLDAALDDELVPGNVAERVKPTGKAADVREELPAADGDTITRHVEGDRIEVCWLLTLAGLRRSEVMGLRWSDFTDDTVTVDRGRTDLDHETTDPKSKKSRRTLPLPAHIAAGLRRTRKARQAETLALGASWDPEAFVAVDEALRPLRPEVYSDNWTRMLTALDLTPVTLHGARHGSVTRMLDAEVPLHVVQAWHGHADPSMTLRYAHARATGLAAAGETLAVAE